MDNDSDVGGGPIEDNYDANKIKSNGLQFVFSN